MTVRKNQPNRTLLRTGLPALFLTLFFFFLASRTWACTCGGPGSPVAMFQRSDVVFLGRGIETDLNTALSPVTFKIEKIWKGLSATQVVLQSGTMCADSVGYGRYLVFAGRSKRDGKIYQYGCSHAREVEGLEVELRLLDLIANGHKEQRILKEILNIAKSHKQISHRIQAVKLITRFRGKSLDNFPKDTEDILINLAKSPDPELSRAARFARSYLEMMRR
jgi:hypothetical protein